MNSTRCRTVFLLKRINPSVFDGTQRCTVQVVTRFSAIVYDELIIEYPISFSIFVSFATMKRRFVITVVETVWRFSMENYREQNNVSSRVWRLQWTPYRTRIVNNGSQHASLKNPKEIHGNNDDCVVNIYRFRIVCDFFFSKCKTLF